MGIIAYPEMIRRGYPVWMSTGIIACGGGIAILIPPSITLILYGIITEESIVALFFAGFTPGIMLAISDAAIIIGLSFFIKLPAGKFSLAKLGKSTFEAWPALLMPVCVLGGLYGGVFTPTEAGAAAAGYAMLFGVISAVERSSRVRAWLFFGGGFVCVIMMSLLGWVDMPFWDRFGAPDAGGALYTLAAYVLLPFVIYGALTLALFELVMAVVERKNTFIKELMPTTQRTINLTAIVYFLLGCVGVFQFLLANKGWPQDIAAWTVEQGFTQMEFLAVLVIIMLFLSMWLTGRRDPGADGADLLPGVADARRRSDPSRHSGGDRDRDGRRHPAGRTQPVRGQRHDGRSGDEGHEGRDSVPDNRRHRAPADAVLPDPGALAAEPDDPVALQLTGGDRVDAAPAACGPAPHPLDSPEREAPLPRDIEDETAWPPPTSPGRTRSTTT